MSSFLTQLLTKLLLALGAVFGAKQWGKTTARKEQLEDDNEQLKKNAKISAGADVDKPFARMRRK